MTRRVRIVAVSAVLVLLSPSVPLAVMRFVNPPTSAVMLLRRLRNLTVVTGPWLRSNRLAAALPMAAIAAEDLTFCRHHGVDVGAIAAQLRVWHAGGRPTGASTITMQLARNLFLWSDRSLFRKTLELWIAPQIALLWPRRRQLEVYLNVAEFGPGVFGVQAGSRYWCGVDATALNANQSALLLAVLPAPERWSVATPDGALRARAAAIRAIVDANGPGLACAGPPSHP